VERDQRLVLLNVVVTPALDAVALRVFLTDPPVTFIGNWPYIWRPASSSPSPGSSTRRRSFRSAALQLLETLQTP